VTHPRALIVGLGNPLATDEGVGPAAIERLLARGLPPDVEAIDAGTDLLAVLDDLCAAGSAHLVDCVLAGSPPGTVHRFALEDLVARAKAGPAWVSAHELTLLETVRLAQMTGHRLPPTVLWGVEPEAVAFGASLTATVSAALDGLLDALLAEIALS
jgi:hydrogenase maturation protease